MSPDSDHRFGLFIQPFWKANSCGQKIVKIFRHLHIWDLYNYDYNPIEFTLLNFNQILTGRQTNFIPLVSLKICLFSNYQCTVTLFKIGDFNTHQIKKYSLFAIVRFFVHHYFLIIRSNNFFHFILNDPIDHRKVKTIK